MKQNLSMLTDLYQLTMLQGYYESGLYKKICVFDLFYRKNPSNNGFAIFAGLDQVIDYIKNLRFTEEDILYLKSINLFSDNFLEYLKNFKFSGDIYSVIEGTVVFPNEPIIRVKAPIMEAQLIETTILNIVNHQSLIATKAARIMWACKKDTVFEFGLRRAQGGDAGVYGARAAIIGGVHATSNVMAGQMFSVPVKGTHAHSWVMSFDSELEAFLTYVKIFPDNCTLLVDTYNTLKSGVKNAITVFTKLKKEGRLPKNYSIRLDSGDLAYLSKEARIMLDDAGLQDCQICASSDLDEYLIEDLLSQGAKITIWGVGTNLITSSDCPAFGGVYKLSAESDDKNQLLPKIKISENPVKVTNPGVKKIVRLYDKETNKIKADLICLEDEIIDETQNLTIFDQNAIWKKMTLYANKYYTKELLKPVFLDGTCVYNSPSVMEIRDFCLEEQESVWEETKRFLNPHVVPVDLSLKLYNLKQQLIKQHCNTI